MQGGECTVVVSFSEQDFVIELKTWNRIRLPLFSAIIL